MESVQIKGVDSTIRKTIGKLESDTNFVVSEKIMTHGVQLAKTEFEVYLNGENVTGQLRTEEVGNKASARERNTHSPVHKALNIHIIRYVFSDA